MSECEGSSHVAISVRNWEGLCFQESTCDKIAALGSLRTCSVKYESRKSSEGGRVT